MGFPRSFKSESINLLSGRWSISGSPWWWFPGIVLLTSDWHSWYMISRTSATNCARFYNIALSKVHQPPSDWRFGFELHLIMSGTASSLYAFSKTAYPVVRHWQYLTEMLVRTGTLQQSRQGMHRCDSMDSQSSATTAGNAHGHTREAMGLVSYQKHDRIAFYWQFLITSWPYCLGHCYWWSHSWLPLLRTAQLQNPTS